MRRKFISGFDGSAGIIDIDFSMPLTLPLLIISTWRGTAVITLNEALLWTDGRYWLQVSYSFQGKNNLLYFLFIYLFCRPHNNWAAIGS
jgi:hypothetical protein